MSDKIIIAVPSKGRLMEQSSQLFADAGWPITRSGSERGYFGKLTGFDHVEIRFLSASEIAHNLDSGEIHAGITGEDLLRETIYNVDAKITIEKRLGFGPADVIVAVPESWLDVRPWPIWKKCL